MEVGEVGQVGRVADPEMLNWDIGAECIVSFITLARDELYALFFFRYLRLCAAVLAQQTMCCDNKVFFSN